MKHKKILSFLGMFSLLLTGCGKKTYSLNDYKIELPFKENFRIVQLTDIHWGIEMNFELEKNHLQEIVDKANHPDLFILTGDNFMNADRATVQCLVDFFDSQEIPWAFTYGNHDMQGTYDRHFLHEALTNAKNCLYLDYEDDTIYGQANFFIDLKENNQTKYRLYIIDSGSYHYTLGNIKYQYDMIQPSQIEQVKAAYEADKAPGLAFFHIPLYEFQTAWDERKEGEYLGENLEKSCPGYTNNGQYDAFKACDIKGCFVGHDHINDSSINYRNEMILSYGVKATDLIYYNDNMIGYKEITLPENSEDFSLSCLKNVMVPYHE